MQRLVQTWEAGWGWIRYYELLLRNTVEALGLQQVRDLETIKEDSRTTSDHDFWSCIPATHSPGKAKSRRPVAPVRDGILRFETQSVTQRNVGAHFPVVLYVGFDVVVGDTSDG